MALDTRCVVQTEGPAPTADAYTHPEGDCRFPVQVLHKGQDAEKASLRAVGLASEWKDRERNCPQGYNSKVGSLAGLEGLCRTW